MRVILALTAALALAACGKPAEEAAAPEPAPAETAQAPAATDAQAAVDAAAAAQLPADIADMADCAGAFAAVGKIDPSSRDQNMQDPWFQEFAGVQMSIMTSANSPGASAMGEAVAARRAHWLAQPAAAQSARAEACKAQY